MDLSGDKELVIKTIQQINTQRAGLTYKGCQIGEDSACNIVAAAEKITLLHVGRMLIN